MADLSTTSNLNTRNFNVPQVLDVEDFRNPVPGMWNDGQGSSTRDTEITLGGLPTFRLDTQGVTSSPASPAAVNLNAVTPSGSGGTFAANTYFWKVSGVVSAAGPTATAIGEGAGSNERSASVGLNGSAPLSWTLIDGYTGYNVYRSTGSGTEVLIAQLGNVSAYTDTGTAAISGQTPLGTSTAANPSRTALLTGVITKRRIHDSFNDQFGISCWFRLTSTNNTSNVFSVLSIYNRDGASAWHGRVWLKPQGNNLPIDVAILDGTATAAANVVPLTGTGAVYRVVDTSTLQNGGGTHVYEPSTGSMDRAGGWHYAKLIVDFTTKKYVSVQIDGNSPVNLSSYTLDRTTTAGFAGLHFG